MKNLTQQILADSPQHGSIPFWSWNDLLNEGELRRQIRQMHGLGMRGFFMHARGGLETEYLSGDWFDAVRACVDEAEALGMEAWAYDENGWPSGFAGGELLKDPRNHACGLTCTDEEIYPADAEDLLGVYRLTENGAVRLFAPDGLGTYKVIRRKRDFSYVDTLNGEITKQFLELTHARYEKELPKGTFGTVMPGFFTDEPQYFRYGTPWSDTLPVRFRKRFGYDVLDGLPALFFDYAGAEEFRYDYHLICHELFYSEFMKPVYDWCDDHGIRLTGHGIEEWGLGGQMMCCGGVMPFYLYQHIPGIDYLGRTVKNISGAKQLGSVCAQSGKRVALSEMFACCGWDVTPRELKRIAELQFAGGVNLICEHLYAYSERGQRKRDFPNHYSEHNPWSASFADFETYFQHLGAALSQGREVADTLVIHPIRSAYLHYKHTVHTVSTNIVTNDTSGIAEQEKRYDALVRRLSDAQIPYHFGDETVMRELQAKTEGATLCIGNGRYDRVILSDCETLDANTVSLLREYAANGGKLLIEGTRPTRIDGRLDDLSFLQSNLDWESLRDACGIRVSRNGGDVPLQMQMRETEWGRLIFLANPSEREYGNVEITLANCDGLCEIDIQTLEQKPLRGRKHPDGSVTVWYDFADSGSCLLAESDLPMVNPETVAVSSVCPLPETFVLTEAPENMLLLEEACVSTDGGKIYSEPRQISRIRDNLLAARYRGPLSLRFAFTCNYQPQNLRLVCEPIDGMTLSVNGQTISPEDGEWRIDRQFSVYDLLPCVRAGENVAELSLQYHQRDEVYRVLYGGGNEALRNCLCFDTEIEAMYLYGDFCVRAVSGLHETEPGILQSVGPFVLEAQTDKIDLRDINRSGYPFFAGTLCAKSTLLHRATDGTRLSLGGRFATCGLVINGRDLGTQLFGDTFELAPYLQEGENDLTLRLCFSNRNLLGPHHAMQSEPMFVTPRIMSCEKAWNEEKCEVWRPEYAFVRFGIGFSAKEQKNEKI